MKIHGVIFCILCYSSMVYLQFDKIGFKAFSHEQFLTIVTRILFKLKNLKNGNSKKWFTLFAYLAITERDSSEGTAGAC